MLCVDPRTDPLWLQLVEQLPSRVFHSPGWIQVLSDTYEFEPRAYVLLDDRGWPQAGIPFCRVSDLFGDRIVSLPFSDYCDPLVSDAHEWRILIDQLLQERCPVVLRCLHNDVPLTDERFTLNKQAKWHGLDLRPELDSLWSAMHDSTHRAIKKSQRAGIVIRAAQSEEELRTFFDMHLRVRKHKYNLLAQPFRFFENIWRRFVDQQHGFILLALYGDKIVAGDFFLEWKDTLYYKFNASLPGDLSHRPNDLLIWEAIRYGKSRGFACLDLGLSDWDQDGLIRYKRKFGTNEKTISFLRHMGDASPSEAEKELRGMLGLLTNRFTGQQVPDLLTERAGDCLYRLFT
jgi:CelD/BcsL family acetyltransferase involved in cellulose biosynthesis